MIWNNLRFTVRINKRKSFCFVMQINLFLTQSRNIKYPAHSVYTSLNFSQWSPDPITNFLTHNHNSINFAISNFLKYQKFETGFLKI